MIQRIRWTPTGGGTWKLAPARSQGEVALSMFGRSPVGREHQGFEHVSPSVGSVNQSNWFAPSRFPVRLLGREAGFSLGGRIAGAVLMTRAGLLELTVSIPTRLIS